MVSLERRSHGRSPRLGRTHIDSVHRDIVRSLLMDEVIHNLQSECCPERLVLEEVLSRVERRVVERGRSEGSLECSEQRQGVSLSVRGNQLGRAEEGTHGQSLFGGGKGGDAGGELGSFAGRDARGFGGGTGGSGHDVVWVQRRTWCERDGTERWSEMVLHVVGDQGEGGRVEEGKGKGCRAHGRRPWLALLVRASVFLYLMRYLALSTDSRKDRESGE